MGAKENETILKSWVTKIKRKIKPGYQSFTNKFKIPAAKAIQVDFLEKFINIILEL